MVILFVIFLLLFARLACLSFRHERRKLNKKLGIEDKSKRALEVRIIRRLLACCRCSKTSKSSSNNDDEQTAAAAPSASPDDQRISFIDSCLMRVGLKKNISQRLPQDETTSPGQKRQISNNEAEAGAEEDENTKANMRLRELDLLDKMRYVGERLERLIEDRFLKMGKFCTKYPKLVLFLGLAFCALMCLGYFNFKIEKDPIKLWSADSSVARKNKKYFDENFGPFYRITQLIIEPKPHVKSLFIPQYDNSVLNITALKPDILLSVYKYETLIFTFKIR